MVDAASALGTVGAEALESSSYGQAKLGSYSQLNERNIESEVATMLQPLADAINRRLSNCSERKRD